MLGPASGSDASVASFLRHSDHWVSASAIRQAIGAWAYSLGGNDRRRPTPEAVRAAVGVACAIRELTLELHRGVRPGGADIQSVDALPPAPADAALLGERAGCTARDVEQAVELLCTAGVVERQRSGSGATVSLSHTILAPHPAVARLGWAEARDRLRRVEASLAPALAVLRELAAQIGAIDDQETVPALRASVRDLEDATGFGRSTISTALDALERARLLDVETRAGRTTRFGLRPAAFGRPDEPPRTGVQDVLRVGGEPIEQPRTPSTGASFGLAGATAAEGRVPTGVVPAAALRPPAGSPTSTAAPVLLGSFGGTPIYAPPGTPLVVACDKHGRWTCQVGPLLQLGPIDPPDT